MERGRTIPGETPAERRTRRAQVDDVETVLEAAARFLETRSRSIAEVRRRLVRAGYRHALVDDAVARLQQLGFLDDEAFARAWVESRDRASPRGEHALRRELGLKGIDREVVEAVLARRRGEPGEADSDGRDGGDPDQGDPDRVAAERLLQRRGGALLREPDPRARVRKTYALLARNGFSPDVCRDLARSFAAVDSALDSLDA